MARSLSFVRHGTALVSVFWLVCLIHSGMSSVCVARDLPDPPESTAEINGLTTRLKTLFEQWKALPSAEPAKSDQIKREVDAALTSYVAKRLNEVPLPSASALQGELDVTLRSK